MKEIIEKGTMKTPNDEEVTYIITMDKEKPISYIKAKNEKKLHLYTYVNQDVNIFISGLLDIIFKYLEPTLEKRLHINIYLFYEKKDNDFGEIRRRSYDIHILKKENEKVESSILSFKRKYNHMNEFYGILPIKDIKIKIFY